MKDILKIIDNFTYNIDVYTGIMQLEILAPYNNLATSMAAALVPALLVPHQSKSDSKDKPSKFNRIVKNSNIIVI